MFLACLVSSCTTKDNCIILEITVNLINDTIKSSIGIPVNTKLLTSSLLNCSNMTLSSASLYYNICWSGGSILRLLNLSPL